VAVSIKVTGSELSDIAVNAKGCAISCASASMMAEAVKGKRLEDVVAAVDEFRSLMRSEKPVEECHCLGDAIALQGVRKHSARIRCAVLAWEALNNAVQKVEKK